jgi:hypothetical protein
MLTKGELLDRMEILYPYDTRFADLRRAYIDRDLTSIFRLMTDYYGGGADEVRKLTMEQNLHVLFRLADGDLDLNLNLKNNTVIEPGDLRKFLLEDNTWSMYRLLLDIQPTQLVNTIKSCHASGTRFDNDSLSQGQLKSKMWIIDELKTLDIKLGTVFLCAGWYGILATLMFEHGIEMDRVRSFDIDPDVVAIADKFNAPWLDDWQFKSITDDIHNINFSSHEWTAWSNANARYSKPIKDAPDTIINTSCEHIDNFDKWYAKIPTGKIVILQSNNYTDIDEHVNTSCDLDAFGKQTPMTEVLYSGEMQLEKYTRFMRIGIK